MSKSCSFISEIRREMNTNRRVVLFLFVCRENLIVAEAEAWEQGNIGYN